MDIDPYPFKLPLILDGTDDTPAKDESTANRFLNEPDLFGIPEKEYIAAGADVVLSPTFSANSERLEAFALKPLATRLNLELSHLTSSFAKDTDALIAGSLGETGRTVIPYGDMDFFDMFFVYLQQAEAIAASGVDLFFVNEMKSLADARAALLACKRQDIPTFVTIRTDEEGITPSGSSALACLLCLQAMGADAFGISGDISPLQLAPILAELRPYARIPLIAKPAVGSLSFDDAASGAAELYKAGASIISGCRGASPAHIAAMRKAVLANAPAELPSAEENDSLVVANSRAVFFIAPDNLEISDYISCSEDMADRLLELEDSCVDVIAVDIVNYEDAEMFARNAHMASLPIIFRSHSKLFLETALILYNGIAMLDSSSDIDSEELERLAQKYGAIIY